MRRDARSLIELHLVGIVDIIPNAYGKAGSLITPCARTKRREDVQLRQPGSTKWRAGWPRRAARTDVVRVGHLRVTRRLRQIRRATLRLFQGRERHGFALGPVQRALALQTRGRDAPPKPAVESKSGQN